MRSEADIKKRFDQQCAELERITAYAEKIITVPWPKSVAFRYEINAARDLLTPFERAQSLCFVAKYDSLPKPEVVDIREHHGRYYPDNIDSFRQLLNEYRPIIQNAKDSTHFSHVHSLCRQKLRNSDPSVDLCISAIGPGDTDLTEQVTQHLDLSHKAIHWLISQLEFGYLYNGILQHADHKFTARYIREYTSGELHYVFIRHAFAANLIGTILNKHYRLLKVVSGPPMGSL